MKKWILLVSLVFGVIAPSHARSYALYVVAHDVVTQQINGQLRFCERALLKGIICQEEVSAFGKKRRMAKDWWSPESYVTATVGIVRPVITEIHPTADGKGMIIYYEARPEMEPQGFSMY